jgi:hypothetical protein
MANFCQRYIELNPVRARLVAEPNDDRWSSYRGNGRGQHDPLFTPHPYYLGIGGDDANGRAADRDLLAVRWKTDPPSPIAVRRMVPAQAHADRQTSSPRCCSMTSKSRSAWRSSSPCRMQ